MNNVVSLFNLPKLTTLWTGMALFLGALIEAFRDKAPLRIAHVSFGNHHCQVNPEGGMNQMQKDVLTIGESK